MLLHVLGCRLTYQGQAETNAEAWFNIALRPRKPEGSLGRTAQDGHLDSHTAPELYLLLAYPPHHIFVILSVSYKFTCLTFPELLLLLSIGMLPLIILLKPTTNKRLFHITLNFLGL